MATSTAEMLIKQLGLLVHPEGGWYRETYRSAEQIASEALPKRFGGPRTFCTSIYFLLQQGDISVLHRIKSDELWYFHSGVALTVHLFTPLGAHREVRIGPDLAHGDCFQTMVPAGCWFGAEVTGAGDFSLVSCTVAPGFDFADFEMGQRDNLVRAYPDYVELIRRLTK
jgi:uncharacterized protein